MMLEFLKSLLAVSTVLTWAAVLVLAGPALLKLCIYYLFF